MPTGELGGGGEDACKVDCSELVARQDQGGEGGWGQEGRQGGQVVRCLYMTLGDGRVQR